MLLRFGPTISKGFVVVGRAVVVVLVAVTLHGLGVPEVDVKLFRVAIRLLESYLVLMRQQ